MNRELLEALAAIGVEVIVLDSPNKVVEVHRAVAKALDEDYQSDWLEDKKGEFR